MPLDDATRIRHIIEAAEEALMGAMNNLPDTPPKLRCAAHRRAWAGYSEAPDVDLSLVWSVVQRDLDPLCQALKTWEANQPPGRTSADPP